MFIRYGSCERKGSCGRKILALAIFLGVSAASVAPAIAQENTSRVSLASVDSQTQSALTHALKLDLQKYIDNHMGRIWDQEKQILVNRVSVSSKGELIVDLSKGFLPPKPARIEENRRDQMKELYVEVIDPVLSVDFRNAPVIFTFDGRSMEEVQPEDPTLNPKKIRASIVEPKKVVISASHGLFYNHGNKRWEYQRPDKWNGIIEDLLTPSHVVELAAFVTTRSEDDVYEPRTRSTTINSTTKRPWWEMAARYNLERVYPGRTDIWGVTASPNDPMREYNKDINSRPRYANEVGADALISLHTNGSKTNPNARGTWVLVKTDRPTDYALGQSILCAMKEQIHAVPAYADYHVDEAPRESEAYGENSGFPDIKKVVVETGFHTNVDDAAALQDPAFITAAMKGVEKGYRLDRDGVTCAPFKITSIPNVTFTYGSGLQKTPIVIQGSPRYPIVYKSEITSCSGSCSGATKTIADASGLTMDFTCRPGGSTTLSAKLKATMTDADQVVLTYEHSVTCEK